MAVGADEQTLRERLRLTHDLFEMLESWVDAKVSAPSGDMSVAGDLTVGDDITLSGAGSKIVFSSVASGANAVEMPTGARLKVGADTDSYFYSSDTGNGIIHTPAFTFVKALGLNASDSPLDGTTVLYDSGVGMAIRGFAPNNGTAVGVSIGNLTNLTNAGAKAIAVYKDELSTEVFSVHASGKPNFSTAAQGTATLVDGAVTVSTAAVRTGSKILLTRNTPGGTVGDLSAPVASIVDGTSFDIDSDSATDTSTVNWFIFN